MPTEAKLGMVLGIGLTLAVAFCLKGKETENTVKTEAPVASIGQDRFPLNTGGVPGKVTSLPRK